MLDILIPHHNDPEGLALSLRSISKQTWGGAKRVVIADDGSKLDWQHVLEEIVDESQLRIDLIRNHANRGRPYTRNVLLDSIQSPYVAWLDAGDEWYPRKLELQMACIDQLPSNESTWLTCNYDWAWVGRKRKKVIQRTNHDQVRALLMGSSLRAYLWTLLGSAQSFKNVGWFDERLPRLQDLDYFIRFVTHGGRIEKLQDDEALCVYHKSDVGRNAEEIRSCNAYIFDKHRVLFNRYGHEFTRMRLYNMEMLAARYAQNNKSTRLAYRYMWRAFRTKPNAFMKHIGKKGLKA